MHAVGDQSVTVTPSLYMLVYYATSGGVSSFALAFLAAAVSLMCWCPVRYPETLALSLGLQLYVETRTPMVLQRPRAVDSAFEQSRESGLPTNK